LVLYKGITVIVAELKNRNAEDKKIEELTRLKQQHPVGRGTLLDFMDGQSQRSTTFFELGFGHVKKILAIVFFYGKLLKSFLTAQKDLGGLLPFEQHLELRREQPLNGTQPSIYICNKAQSALFQ